jgi:hypothetical protein
LGISGVPTKSHYWNYITKDSSEQGAQIDMMLEHINGSNNIRLMFITVHGMVKNEHYNEVVSKDINISEIMQVT